MQFGVQPINTQTTLTVTITNTSTELIRFAGGSIGAQRHHDVNPFGEDLSQIDLNTCLAFVGHLPPGGTCTAPLTFTPPEPGNYHGRYRIEFFRPEFPDEHDTFAVSLSGRGIDN